MFRRILDVFRLRSERRYCLLWYQQKALTGLDLPDVPTIDLAKQPIRETGPISLVPGDLLAQDRAKRGLKTIRLVPMWPDDGWLNSAPRPQMASYEPPDIETEHMPAFVKALHARRNS